MASYTGSCNIRSYDRTSSLLHQKLAALPTEQRERIPSILHRSTSYINEISTRSVVIHQWSGYQHATYKYRFELYTHS